MVGSRALVELLEQEGVRVLFGNPGTTELPVLDALAVDEGVRYVLGLQEAAVMAMADGYARASGALGVASLHLAPGLGNAMGIGDAGPMLVEVDLERSLTEEASRA
jgi:benzoylformate decarboxylase